MNFLSPCMATKHNHYNVIYHTVQCAVAKVNYCTSTESWKCNDHTDAGGHDDDRTIHLIQWTGWPARTKPQPPFKRFGRTPPRWGMCIKRQSVCVYEKHGTQHHNDSNHLPCTHNRTWANTYTHTTLSCTLTATNQHGLMCTNDTTLFSRVWAGDLWVLTIDVLYGSTV